MGRKLLSLSPLSSSISFREIPVVHFPLSLLRLGWTSIILPTRDYCTCCLRRQQGRHEAQARRSCSGGVLVHVQVAPAMVAELGDANPLNTLLVRLAALPVGRSVSLARESRAYSQISHRPTRAVCYVCCVSLYATFVVGAGRLEQQNLEVRLAARAAHLGGLVLEAVEGLLVARRRRLTPWLRARRAPRTALFELGAQARTRIRLEPRRDLFRRPVGIRKGTILVLDWNRVHRTTGPRNRPRGRTILVHQFIEIESSLHDQS